MRRPMFVRSATAFRGLLAAGVTALTAAPAWAGGPGGNGGGVGAFPFVVGGLITAGVVAAGWLVLSGRRSMGGPATSDAGPAAAPAGDGQTSAGPAGGPWAEPPALPRAPNPLHQLWLPAVLVVLVAVVVIPGVCAIYNLFSEPLPGVTPTSFSPQFHMPTGPAFDFSKQPALYPQYRQPDLPNVPNYTPPPPSAPPAVSVPSR